MMLSLVRSPNFQQTEAWIFHDPETTLSHLIVIRDTMNMFLFWNTQIVWKKNNEFQ